MPIARQRVTGPCDVGGRSEWRGGPNIHYNESSPLLAHVILAGVFTFFACLMAGRLLLSGLSIQLYREEECFLSFVVGSALLSTIVFVLTAAHLAYLGVFLAAGAAIIAAGAWRGEPPAESFEPLSLVWKMVFIVPYVAFGVVYLALAFGPEVSPDGSAYRVGLVARYYYAHSFPLMTTSMFASLSQGIEMLFLFAFPFGKQAATAVVHLLFLLMLPFAIYRSRRQRRL